MICYVCGSPASAQCHRCNKYLCTTHSHEGLVPADRFLVLCPDHAGVAINTRLQAEESAQQRDKILRDIAKLEESLKVFIQKEIGPEVLQILHSQICQKCNGLGYERITIRQKSEGGSKPSRWEYRSDEEHKKALEVWRGRVWHEGSDFERSIDPCVGRESGSWAYTGNYFDRKCDECTGGNVFSKDELDRRVSSLARLNPKIVRLSTQHFIPSGNLAYRSISIGRIKRGSRYPEAVSLYYSYDPESR